MSDSDRAAVTVGEPTRHDAAIELVEHSEAWTTQFEAAAERIRSALGDRALLLEHVGSTSVPGLVAKPRIDICLVVADSADEAAYVEALQAVGFVLRIREPDWHEHRMLRGERPDVNLHVFSAGSAEVERMIRFRNRLRTDADDRELYAATKRRLAAQRWDYVQDYADAKSAVVEDILSRA
jgi:GrpB-like predicted nucleotidyltransferase (UPF0157 family)